MPDLSIEIAGHKLKNPVMPASGTFEPLVLPYPVDKFRRLGALVNKTITLDPRPGNPPPRTWETTAGLLNSIGIPAEGLKDFCKSKLPKLRELTDCLIISLAGFTVEEFVLLAKTIEDTGLADFLELNLSCPNLEKQSIWAAEEESLAKVLNSVCKAVKLPVIAKLSPNVTDIGALASIAEQNGASALSLVNTFRGMAIDIRVKKPALGNITGGLSGPAIKPLALFAIWSVYEKVKIPLIGMGGICSWQDALEFILAGATAVAVGMCNFIDPEALWKIIDGLDEYLAKNKYSSLTELRGLAHKNI